MSSHTLYLKASCTHLQLFAGGGLSSKTASPQKTKIPTSFIASPPPHKMFRWILVFFFSLQKHCNGKLYFSLIIQPVEYNVASFVDIFDLLNTTIVVIH